MGGALAQYVAAEDSSTGAAVSFYGGFKKLDVRWEKLQCPILLIYGGQDKGVPPSHGEALKQKLQSLDKDVQLVVYPGADHAFFNDTRPEVYNPEAAQDAWRRTIEFFRKHLR
jgi:carboxymethylenebutenolidase